MNFHELLAELHTTKPQPNPKYWEIVIQHADVILYELVLSEKQDVAQKLKMSASKFSSILPILKAIVKNKNV